MATPLLLRADLAGFGRNSIPVDIKTYSRERRGTQGRHTPENEGGRRDEQEHDTGRLTYFTTGRLTFRHIHELWGMLEFWKAIF